jgi:deoxycytidine triphosphate deaminase
MAMLSRSAVPWKDMISRYCERAARASTYDLTIDCVIDSNGTEYRDQYVLRPQEVAWVVSREIVSLPSDVTAMAHIKTGLCNEGLLALNTGIVDPLWSGPLSTPMLNFGKAIHVLRPGDQFLRLTFHKHARESGDEYVVGSGQYIADKRTQALRFFGEKFLDANAIVREALNSNIFKYASVIGIASGIFIAVVAAVLTLGAIIINSNAFYAPTYYSAFRAPVIEKSKRQMDEQIEALENRIKALEEK